jgi:CubicO group peptidase (beta-lactamase class C family)
MPPSFVAAQAALERALAAKAFPAAVVEVGTANQPLWRRALGTLTFDSTSPAADDDTIFDLASLTKVLCTAPLVMRQIEHGALGLDDPVSAHLPAWRGADREAVTIRDLLAHCSGLPAHPPLYQTCRGRRAFEDAIAALPLEYVPRTRSLYSDLDFILLGFILERAVPLTAQFDALRLQMGAIQDLQFHPPEIWKRRTAPTQHNSIRGRLLVGEVDDDNAWALGGAAGHAGLFGSARAVGDCARHLLQVLDWRTGAFGRETLRMFVTRRTDVPGSSRALGWDTMLPTSSCGARMSAAAFGHTGFTGTSLWIDPEPGVYVVLLTNRVHPAPGDPAVIRQVRRDVHDAVMRTLQATEA